MTMDKKKIKPSRLIALTAVSAVLIAIVAIAAAAAIEFIKPFVLLKLDEPKSAVPIAEDYSGKTVEMSLEELRSDERVTFDQSMMLINAENLLPEDFQPEVSEYNDSGVIMNDCIKQAYSDIAADVRDRFSESLYISSAYRSPEEQLSEIAEEGGVAQALGASEHQAGLALDVYVMYYAGEGFLNCEAGRWVNNYCFTRGFIIRYPFGASDKTGIGYEPWHIRYVGAPHAEYIMRNGITFEDYVGIFQGGKVKLISTDSGDYVVTRFTDSVTAPKKFVSATVSPDNTGGFFASFLIK